MAVGGPPLVGRTRWAALLGSLGYVLVLLASASWAYGPADVAAALVSAQVGPWLWWALLGGAVVGGALAATVVRHGLVAPLLGVAVVYVATLYRMWQVLRSPNPPLPGTPLDLYLVGWPLLLALALALGVLERQVRALRQSGRNTERG